MNVHQWLEKLRQLPEMHRKAILIGIVAIVAIGLGYFLLKDLESRVVTEGKLLQSQKFPGIDVNVPSLNLLQTTSASDDVVK